MLGYREHPEWRDMSEYVVHFTKDGMGGADGYWPMMSILSQGHLKPSGPFGVASEFEFLGSSQSSVCLSEVPLDQLARVVEHRSKYGIGFKQTVLIENGGARVWYVNEPSPLAECWRGMIAEQAAVQDPDAALWSMTPFVDLASESAWFSRYEWEREWRVPGGLTFKPSDVAFLFVPEALHTSARSFFNNVEHKGLGPRYSCPLLDAAWPDDRLQEVYARVEINGPPTDDDGQ